MRYHKLWILYACLVCKCLQILPTSFGQSASALQAPTFAADARALHTASPFDQPLLLAKSSRVELWLHGTTLSSEASLLSWDMNLEFSNVDLHVAEASAQAAHMNETLRPPVARNTSDSVVAYTSGWWWFGKFDVERPALQVRSTRQAACTGCPATNSTWTMPPGANSSYVAPFGSQMNVALLFQLVFPWVPQTGPLLQAQLFVWDGFDWRNNTKYVYSFRDARHPQHFIDTLYGDSSCQWQEGWSAGNQSWTASALVHRRALEAFGLSTERVANSSTLAGSNLSTMWNRTRNLCGFHSCMLFEVPANRSPAVKEIVISRGLDLSTLLGTSSQRWPAKLVGGSVSACIVYSDGAFSCWGDNTNGLLGYGNSESVGTSDRIPSSFGFVPLGEPVHSLSFSQLATCAVTLRLRLRCWGFGGYFQLFRGLDDSSLYSPQTAAGSTEAVLHDGNPHVLLASMRRFGACILTDLPANNVYCIGSNLPGFGYVGANTTDTDIPSSDPRSRLSLGGLRAVDLSSSERYSCIVFENGGLKCWGRGVDGALGQGNEEDLGGNEGISDIPFVNLGSATFQVAHVRTSTETPTTCVIYMDGRFGCFGRIHNNAIISSLADDLVSGALGADRPPGVIRDPFVFEDTDAVVELAVLQYSICALYVSGSVRCSAINSNTAGGHSLVATAADMREMPLRTPYSTNEPIEHIVQVRDGFCYMMVTGKVECNVGGNGPTAMNGLSRKYVAPHEMEGAHSLNKELDREQATCQLDLNGFVSSCMPRSAIARLSFSESTVPSTAHRQRQFSHGISSFEVSNLHSCAILLNGEIVCWGADAFGMLGRSGIRNIGSQVPITDSFTANFGVPIIVLAIGHYSTCGLTASGNVRCFGRNSVGESGYPGLEAVGGTPQSEAAHIGDIQLGAKLVTLAGKNQVRCGVTEHMDLVCFGRGQYGLNGHGMHVGDDEHPADVGIVDMLGTKFTGVSVGSSMAVGLTNVGSIVVWGLNRAGRLGRDGLWVPGVGANLGDDESPASLPALSLPHEIVDIAAFSHNGCVVDAVGDVFCWGLQNGGTLGDPSIPDRETKPLNSSSPIRIGAAAVSVSLHSDAVCALLIDGSISCWGSSVLSGLGTATRVGLDVHPVDVPRLGIEAATQVRVGRRHACALGRSGRLYCWGVNSGGALGTGELSSLGVDEPMSDTSISVVRNFFALPRHSRVLGISPNFTMLGTGNMVAPFHAFRCFDCDLLELQSLPMWMDDLMSRQTKDEVVSSPMKIGSSCIKAGMPVAPIGPWAEACPWPDFKLMTSQETAFLRYDTADSANSTEVSPAGRDIVSLKGQWWPLAAFQSELGFQIRIGGKICSAPRLSSNAKQLACAVPVLTNTSSSSAVLSVEHSIPFIAQPWIASKLVQYSAPIVSNIVPSVDLSISGSSVTLTGISFGLPFRNDSGTLTGLAWPGQVNVGIDGRLGACVDAEHVGNTKIFCTLGPMYGNHILSLHVADQVSNGFRVSFAEPQIERVSPEFLTWSPISNETFASIWLFGSNLAINTTGVDFYIGSSICGRSGFGHLASANASAVLCTNIDAGMLPSDVRQLDLKIVRAGQSGELLSAVRVYGQMRIFSMTPSVVPVDGVRVIVEGLNFGPATDAVGPTSTLIQNVTVGPQHQTCANVSIMSSTRLACDIPAGTGKLFPLQANRRFGDTASLRSTQLTYSQPTITHVLPSFLVSSSNTSAVGTLLLFGTNFGASFVPTPTSQLSLTIDGVSCPHLTYLNSSAIKCEAFPLGAVAGTTRAQVELDVSGLVADTSALQLRIVGQPSLRSVSPTVLLNHGGVLTLSGTEFGVFRGQIGNFSEPLIANITVGTNSQPCGRIEVLTESTASCEVPAGVGDLQPLQVLHAGGWMLRVQGALQYQAPQVTSILPTYVLAPALASATLTVNISGQGFGTVFSPGQLGGADLSAQIGPLPCPRVRWHSPTLIACENLPVALLPGNSRLDVQVTVGGLVNIVGGVRLRTFAAPEVVSCLPAIVSAAGGGTVTIVGSGFGLQDSDILRVFIGAAQCINTVLESDTTLKCDAPSRALAVQGRLPADSLTISVQLSSGITTTSLPGLINFASPAIFFVRPSLLLAAAPSRTELSYDVSVSGLALGNADLSQSGSMTVCGVSCRDAGGVLQLSANSRKLVCSGFMASALPAGVSAASPLSVVRVVTNEGLAVETQLGAIQVLDAPLISSVQPTVAKTGDIVTLSGRGFGWKVEDIASIQVGLVSVPQSSVTWSGSLALSFPIPAPRSSSVEDTAGLPITLTLTSGLVSAVSAQSVFAFERDALPPETAVSDPCAYRSETDGNIIHVEFMWVDDFITTSFPVQVWAVQFTTIPFFRGAVAEDVEERLLQNVRNTDDVTFSTTSSPQCSAASGPRLAVISQLAPHLLTSGNSSARTAASNTHGRRMQSVGSGERITVRVLNTPAEPIWIRVQAVTDAASIGSTRGPPSTVVGPIYPSCRREEYLATQYAARGEWSASTCQPCPDGAVCGGVPWEALTNARGYYRVPWSEGALTFSRCKLDEACPEGASLYMLEPDSPLLFAAVPGAARSQNSSSIQGALSTANTDNINMACSEGYHSVLCSNCQLGFSGNIDNTCEKCGPLPLVRLALFGGVLTGTLVVGFLIRTAIRSRGLPGKAHVALAKLLFVHLQQIALAAAFPMKWPAALQAMFAVFDAGSNVGEALLSVDCLGFEMTSTFLGNTVVQLLLPFMACALVAVLWGSAEVARKIRWWCAPARPDDPEPSINGYTPRVLRELSAPKDEVVIASHNPMAASLSPRGGSKAPGGDLDRETGSLQDLSLPSRAAHTATKAPTASAEAKQALPVRLKMQPVRSSGRKRRQSRMSIVSLQDVPTTQMVQWTADKMKSGGVKKAKPVTFAAVRRRVGASLEAAPVVLTPWKCFIVSIFVIMFVFQLNLTRSSLTLMTCDEISGRRLLSADLQFDCNDSANHGWMYGLGVPAVVLYGLGVSAVTLAVLYNHRNQLNDPEVRAVLGFLFSSFRDERYYWEVVIQARKVALAFIGVLLRPSGIGVQTTAATTLMVVSSLVHNSALPFRTHVLNHFENASIVVALITLNGGSTLIDSTSSFSMKSFVTVLILAINLAFLVAVVAALARLVCGDLETQVRVRRAFRAIGAKHRGKESSLKPLSGTA